MNTTKLLDVAEIVLCEDIARIEIKDEVLCRQMLKECQARGSNVVWSSREPSQACRVRRGQSIYFIICRQINRIKIGYSESVGTRIHNHSTACPFPIELLKSIPGTVADERKLHAKFSHLRRHLEWFEASPELLSYIQSL